jgi:hypothetical protein
MVAGIDQQEQHRRTATVLKLDFESPTESSATRHDLRFTGGGIRLAARGGSDSPHSFVRCL